MSEQRLSKEHGQITSPTSIRFERVLPGPLERVWAYLIEPDKRAQWFCGGPPIDLRDGADFELVFDHRNISSEPIPEKWEGQFPLVTKARILRVDPPRLLSFAWLEEDGEHTDVTIELAEQDDGVLLTLTHTKLGTPELLVDVAGGWHTHLALLDDLLSGRKLRPFWATVAGAEADYRRQLGMEEPS